MTYKHIQHIDKDKDLIVPCSKGNLKHLKELVSIESLDFEGEFLTSQLFFGTKGNRIYALGLGEEKDAAKVGEAYRKLCFDCKKYWTESIQVYADIFPVNEPAY